MALLYMSVREDGGRLFPICLNSLRLHWIPGRLMPYGGELTAFSNDSVFQRLRSSRGETQVRTNLVLQCKSAGSRGRSALKARGLGEGSARGQGDRQELSLRKEVACVCVGGVTRGTSDNAPRVCRGLGKDRSEQRRCPAGKSLGLSWVLSRSWPTHSDGGPGQPSSFYCICFFFFL